MEFSNTKNFHSPSYGPLVGDINTTSSVVGMPMIAKNVSELTRKISEFHFNLCKNMVEEHKKKKPFPSPSKKSTSNNISFIQKFCLLF